MLLSIVIPIYNVEKYIKTCLDSILPQINERKDVEIILINDGTPDRSADIATELIQNHENVLIYNQPNQGLSCARNNGLDKAKGDYVWFIDSDDSLEPSSINGIIDSLIINQPDLLQLNYQKTYEDNRCPIPVIEINKGCISGKKLLKIGSLPAPAQFTIYRRNFLLDNNLRFVSGLLHEDSEFKPRVTYLAETIIWHTPIVYNYLQRSNGSIMSSIKYRNAHDIVVGINNLLKFAEEQIKEKECVLRFNKLISMNINTLLYGTLSMPDIDRQLTIKLLKKNKTIFNHMILSSNLKYMIEGIILLLNVRFGFSLYRIFNLR